MKEGMCCAGGKVKLPELHSPSEPVFPNIQTNYKNHDWLSERAILAAKTKYKVVYEINNVIQSNIKSETGTYKSDDCCRSRLIN